MGSKTRLSSYCTKQANNGVNLVTSRKINTRLSRPIAEKYANSSKYYMDDTDFFSTETITVPINLKLLAIAQLSLDDGNV